MDLNDEGHFHLIEPAMSFALCTTTVYERNMYLIVPTYTILFKDYLVNEQNGEKYILNSYMKIIALSIH